MKDKLKAKRKIIINKSFGQEQSKQPLRFEQLVIEESEFKSGDK